MAFLDEIGLQYYDQKVKEYVNKQIQELDPPSSSDQVTGIIYNELKDSIAEGIDGSLGALNSALGDRSHAEGGPYQAGAVGSIAQGRASHAEGATTKAVADAAHTEGILTVAGREVTALQQAATDLGISGTIEEIAAKLLGYGAHAEGSLSLALGSSSHAEGDKTQALANATHSEGSETVAFGEASHAEGFKTRAEGNQSHAEGRITLATGNSSHAEGNETEASGAYSHAEGSNTIAEKRDSHAEGAFTRATGIASHAEGEHTSTSNTAEHAEGAYNYTHTGDTDSERTMSSIGIGNETRKKNAFEVMKNGDVYVYGVGGYDGTNSVQRNLGGIKGHAIQNYLPGGAVSIDLVIEPGSPGADVLNYNEFDETVIAYKNLNRPVIVHIKRTVYIDEEVTSHLYTTIGNLEVSAEPAEGATTSWVATICIGDLIFVRKGESVNDNDPISWTQGLEIINLIPKTSSFS